tara:strand:+ start:837 stop:1220 length:384 start_codon:yes stop_codon:yes gene_type:complete
MLISNPLTEGTFLSFAMKMYDNPNCSGPEEFDEDLKRIKYVKRLLNKYVEKNELKSRLIVNHTIIMGNVFGPVGSARLLFYRLDENLMPPMKTVLHFLSVCPKYIPEVDLSKVPVDPKILKLLKEEL